MAGERLLVNDLYVRHLRSALRYGSSALGQIPDLIKYIIREEAWRERFVLQTHQPVRFKRFVDFVTTPPPEGLGTDLATIERLCRVDVEAVKLLDLVTARPKRVHAADGDSVPITKRSNRAHAAFRRLRKARPTLKKGVLAGERSPTAAALDDAVQRPTLTVPADPRSAIRALVNRFGPDEVREAVKDILGQQ